MKSNKFSNALQFNKPTVFARKTMDVPSFTATMLPQAMVVGLLKACLFFYAEHYTRKIDCEIDLRVGLRPP